MSDSYILSIDQGTSSTKAILFNSEGKLIKKATASLTTKYTSNGFVEQDPQDILNSVLEACKMCLDGFSTEKISCIGISNQRETFVLWDRQGNPVHSAIVWACKRSTSICENLKDQEPWIKQKTGLVIDPYFSGTKLLWILEHKKDIATQIAKGDIFFGTIDTWLLFNLTNGQSFFTDHSNASRTLFFNLNNLKWDNEILTKWNLEQLNLPAIKPSSSDYGETDLFGLLNTKIPITAMIGDSHASMFGEACFNKGETKMTLGTGSSLLMHIGNTSRVSNQGLLSTIGWSTNNEIAYAWEGAIVACGSMIEWLKSIDVIKSAQETEGLAFSIDEPSDVYLVPAFSGLGAPFWQMDRKASFHGLTFGTSKSHLVKATLESICFQIKAVIEAMQKDLNSPINQVAMHGGLSKNKFVQQGLSELLIPHIKIQENADISAQGATFLAGLHQGIFKSLDEISALLKKEKLEKMHDNLNLKEKYIEWLQLIKN